MNAESFNASDALHELKQKSLTPTDSTTVDELMAKNNNGETFTRNDMLTIHDLVAKYQ
jgi:hypothetical protein